MGAPGTATAEPVAAAGTGPADRRPAGPPQRRLRAGRRPWWVWAAPFVLVLTVLAVRSFICTPAQVRAGAPFWFRSPAAPPGVPVIATLKYSAIAAGAP